MSTARKAVAVVVALAVVGLLSAFLLPVAINEIEGTTNESINSSVGETAQVNGELNTTLDSVNANSNATYTLQSDGQSITKTIDEGANATYSFNRGDVVVTVTDAGSNYAVASYEYTKDYAYSDGASSLWGLLGLAMVLCVFMVLIRKAMSAM